MPRLLPVLVALGLVATVTSCSSTPASAPAPRTVTATVSVAAGAEASGWDASAPNQQWVGSPPLFPTSVPQRALTDAWDATDRVFEKSWTPASGPTSTGSRPA